MKQLIAFANINIGTRTVEEDFKVDSKETAEADIKEVVGYFNDSLRPGESPRLFESIVRFEEQEIIEKGYTTYDDDDDYDNDVYEDDHY